MMVKHVGLGTTMAVGVRHEAIIELVTERVTVKVRTQHITY